MGKSARYWRDRLDQVARDYPSVRADAADWLADDDTFVAVVRDIIKVGLAEPHAIGPRRDPTPAEARAEWRHLADAVRDRPPLPPVRHEPVALVTVDGPGCMSCARVDRWVPPDPRLRRPSHLAGVLPVPLTLCSWCVTRTRTTRRLPTVEEVARHHRGERVPRDPGPALDRTGT